MKSKITLSSYTFWWLIFIIFSLSIKNVNSQENTSGQDSLANELPFLISEIPNEFTKLMNRLIEITDDIQPI